MSSYTSTFSRGLTMAICLALAPGCVERGAGTSNPPASATAVALASAYDENSVEADKRYLNQELLVTGTIKLIDKEKIDQKPSFTVVVLYGKDETANVVCSMRPSQKDVVAGLKAGQEVAVKGTCDGALGRNIKLRGCIIQ